MNEGSVSATLEGANDFNVSYNFKRGDGISTLTQETTQSKEPKLAGQRSGQRFHLCISP